MVAGDVATQHNCIRDGDIASLPALSLYWSKVVALVQAKTGRAPLIFDTKLVTVSVCSI